MGPRHSHRVRHVVGISSTVNHLVKISDCIITIFVRTTLLATIHLTLLIYTIQGIRYGKMRRRNSALSKQKSTVSSVHFPKGTEISAHYFSSNDLFQISNESISLQMHEAYQQTSIHDADTWVVEVNISSNI